MDLLVRVWPHSSHRFDWTVISMLLIGGTTIISARTQPVVSYRAVLHQIGYRLRAPSLYLAGTAEQFSGSKALHCQPSFLGLVCLAFAALLFFCVIFINWLHQPSWSHLPCSLYLQIGSFTLSYLLDLIILKCLQGMGKVPLTSVLLNCLGKFSSFCGLFLHWP